MSNTERHVADLKKMWADPGIKMLRNKPYQSLLSLAEARAIKFPNPNELPPFSLAKDGAELIAEMKAKRFEPFFISLQNMRVLEKTIKEAHP